MDRVRRCIEVDLISRRAESKLFSTFESSAWDSRGERNQHSQRDHFWHAILHPIAPKRVHVVEQFPACLTWYAYLLLIKTVTIWLSNVRRSMEGETYISLGPIVHSSGGSVCHLHRIQATERKTEKEATVFCRHLCKWISQWMWSKTNDSYLNEESAKVQETKPPKLHFDDFPGKV